MGAVVPFPDTVIILQRGFPPEYGTKKSPAPKPPLHVFLFTSETEGSQEKNGRNIEALWQLLEVGVRTSMRQAPSPGPQSLAEPLPVVGALGDPLEVENQWIIVSDYGSAIHGPIIVVFRDDERYNLAQASCWIGPLPIVLCNVFSREPVLNFSHRFAFPISLDVQMFAIPDIQMSRYSNVHLLVLNRRRRPKPGININRAILILVPRLEVPKVVVVVVIPGLPEQRDVGAPSTRYRSVPAHASHVQAGTPEGISCRPDD